MHKWKLIGCVFAALALSACQGPGTGSRPALETPEEPGGRGEPAAVTAHTGDAAAQARSGEMSASETVGPEGTDDSGQGVGFGAISGGAGDGSGSGSGGSGTSSGESSGPEGVDDSGQSVGFGAISG